VTHDRRAALDGLARILDAGAPEDLFTGPEDEARFLYDLLVDATRARSSRFYWEICRMARRRRVSADYVVDRASVLLGAIEERRRTDLYRILGVPPLASGDLIREHWLDLAKQHHPDHGGISSRFQQAKQAYDVLRDADRRAEYERFWLRVLGPFERVAPQEDVPPLAPAHPIVGTWARLPGSPHAADHADAGNGVSDAILAADGAASTVRGAAGLVARARALVAPVSAAELARLQAEVDAAVARCEALRDQLAALASLQQALGAARA
jgi:hypothetical protein